MSEFEYIDYFLYIVSTYSESSQIYCRMIQLIKMDHKTLTIAPIVASLAVILLLGANIGL